MNTAEFVKNIYQSVVKENLSAYEDLFANTGTKDVTSMWCI